MENREKDSFLALAQERYSVRGFSDRKVEKEKVEAILHAASLAPTAKNLQPVRVFVLESEESLKKISSLVRFPFVGEASVVFAVAGDPGEGWVRPFDGKSFADVDATIVATHMMLEIASLGLGTTWIGFFDEDLVKEAFPQMKGLSVVGLFPVGYPKEGATPSERHFSRKKEEELSERL